MFRLTAILVVLLILVLNLAAQKQYSFLQVNNIDGLGNNSATCILKDSRGFIWIGTQTGLSRYDGSEILNYKYDSTDPMALPHNYIHEILEDSRGNLIIKTHIGYHAFDIQKEVFYPEITEYLKFEPGQVIVSRIYCDNNKVLWVNTESNPYYLKYNSSNHYLENVFSDNESENQEVIEFIHSNDAYYFLFDNGTIECYDSSYKLKYTNHFLSGKIKGGSVGYGMFVDTDNDIWFYGNNDGVYHFKSTTEKWNHYAVNTGEVRLSSNIIYEVIQDEEGLIWIATDHGGINIIDKITGKATVLKAQSDNDKSIADNSVTDLFIDDEGIMWAATNKNGVSYYHESIHKFPHYRNLQSDQSSLPYADVNCFKEDLKGNLWIGTNGGGLVYYDRLKDKYTSYKHNKKDPYSISGDVVMSLLIDYKGELWVGTYAGGVSRFNGKIFKNYVFNTNSAHGLPDNNIWSIIEDDSLNVLVGTNGGGIVKYNREADHFDKLANKGKLTLPSPFISTLCKLSNGNICVGTYFGVIIYNVKNQQYEEVKGLNQAPVSANKLIHDVFEDSRGLLWLATNEGLTVVDPHTSDVKHFVASDGLAEDVVKCIEEDESQTIWISKSAGLSQIKVSKLPKDTAYDFQIHHYTKEDGLQANEFNPNASYFTTNNELIFGGVNGFNLFKSENIKSNIITPRVTFTGFQVYNRNVSPNLKLDNFKLLDRSIISTQQIVLKHSMNVFSIDFAGLNYFTPNKIKYKYKLEGFNEEWLGMDNSQTKVTFTNLNAGDYVLKVKASNNDGFWNDDYATLEIKVLPPFYLTWWAYIIYAFMFITTLLYLVYSMVRKERHKFLIEQERLKNKQNHELDEMKLRFLTNVSHEFRTPLTLILTPLYKLLEQVNSESDKKLLKIIDRNARNLLGLVNQLLDFRKLEVHGMRYNPSYGDIIDFLNKVIADFEDSFSGKNIEFVFLHETDQFMLYFDNDKLQKVMMNLLSNALKFTPEHGAVTVKLNLDESKDIVSISVVDTGCGINRYEIDKVFVRFFQSEHSKKHGITGSGIGLNLALEMVQLHNGTIQVESEEGAGATFTVSLPVEKSDRLVGMEEEQIAVEEKVEEEGYETTTATKYVILLVEDNVDFRTFMQEMLSDKYMVHVAADGQIAYNTVHKVLPDLIISDVAMPNVDGLELCKMLRKDIRTSHIPIVLLTARTADEDKIKGLETGADDYIAKPFNMELLMLTVHNLLQKSKVQKQFQKAVDISPSEVQITSMDEKLIEKAVALVEKNMAEADFSIVDLSKELGMSRVYLYKKMLAITGKSPIEFVRTIRLKRGAQLLEKSQMNIAEVAYEVGFNNPRYFSKHFKEEYGMLPTAYVKDKLNKSAC